jgi:hypothetical protein
MLPSWDAPGTLDDPGLDDDDTSGTGPQNINIAVPVVGNTYRVGVHHFAGSGCRTATVSIYCDEASVVPVATCSQAICGNADPNLCEFWRVADVQWTGANSCSVTELGTVITTAEAETGR